MNTNKTNSPWPAHRVQFITLCTHEKQTTLGRIYKGRIYNTSATPIKNDT